MKQRLMAVILLLACALPGGASAASLKPFDGPTPPLALADLDGGRHELANYQGQVVMVQFWATYCTPCRKEMPSMNRLMKKMADTGKPFVILAVDMAEPEAEVRAFVEQVKPEFTILMDTDGSAIAAWKVFAAPATFILDPRGKIRYTLFGATDWDSPEIVEALAALHG